MVATTTGRSDPARVSTSAAAGEKVDIALPFFVPPIQLSDLRFHLNFLSLKWQSFVTKLLSDEILQFYASYESRLSTASVQIA